MVSYERIPEELRSLKRWVCVWEDSKVPMKAWEKEAASSTNPDTWSDFETALESCNKGFYDYCGFVFAGDGYVGIDIDAGVDTPCCRHCIEMSKLHGALKERERVSHPAPGRPSVQG